MAAQIDEGWEVSWRRGLWCFVRPQNYYILLHGNPEPDVLPACERHGLGLLPYCPLASGALTGKYRRGEPPPEDARLGRPDQQGWRDAFLTERNFAIVERLSAFVSERGRTLLELVV